MLITSQGATFNGFGGLQYGGDLRWATPQRIKCDCAPPRIRRMCSSACFIARVCYRSSHSRGNNDFSNLEKQRSKLNGKCLRLFGGHNGTMSQACAKTELHLCGS